MLSEKGLRGLSGRLGSLFGILCAPRRFRHRFWEDFERQVIIKGHAKKSNEDISSNYFNSRPKGSQIGALVSERQSSVIPSKDFLIEKFNSLIQEFENKDIPQARKLGWIYCESG